MIGGVAVDRLRGWVDTRSRRERRLLAIAALTTGATLLGLAARATVEDLNTLRSSIATRQRELAAVRGLAAQLRPAQGSRQARDSAESLLARLEHAATAIIPRERIASMTPVTTGSAAAGEERIALDVRGASLRETVALLHALESADPPLHVVRVGLRRHVGEPGRFTTSLEVAAIGTP